MTKILLCGVERLKALILPLGDKRMAALFSRIEMKVAHKVSYHAVSYSATDDPCAVCHKPLEESISILECGHTFHKNCIGRFAYHEPDKVCATCQNPIDPQRYPWVLDDLLEHSERKCHACKGCLCDNRPFRVCWTVSQDAAIPEISLRCSECIFKKDGLRCDGRKLKVVRRTSEKQDGPAQ